MSTEVKVREKARPVLDRISHARRVRLPRLPSAFPWAAPTWPTSVARPPAKRTLGVDYDTEWARSYAARLARVVVTETMTRPVAYLLADPKIDGVDRVDQLDEPVIFAANHQSHVDTPLLLSILPDRWRHRTVVAAGADYFFDRHWKAVFFAFIINAIPIERLRVNRRSAELAEALLAEDWSLLIFPEGGRTPDGWGQVHHPGWARVAVRSGRPVVPIYLSGTRKMLPRHGSRLRPASTRVTFGSPIRAAGMDTRELAAKVEKALAVLADEQTTDWWTARRRAAAGVTPALTGPPVGAWRRSWALADREGRDRRRRRPEPRWPKL